MRLVSTISVLAALSLSLTSTAFASTQTLDFSNPGPGTTYWTPDEASKDSSPYYRWQGDDWSWQFSPVADTINSASVSVSAFDVDANIGEIDEIYGWSNDSLSWELLGSLAGAGDIWSFTSFDLASSWFDEINAGLQVRIVIDTLGGNWAVSLAKSSLITNGGTLPSPNPSAVPVPAAAWLFGSALAGLGLISNRRKTLALNSWLS
ncbi:VPLPA-CTERM sorting domain-containing protein [Methylobacter sp. YRD-M1]|uniref:VPLPA-CTERM sorting domain-containing protein n=1 Tax=Methylobacter sp. YRD-M1 TaxID=2911520 RepID=UPI00227CEBCE|nr:VPLPA-CTERM sorting domain-containing protein [Methylobacter sp. YRD-M1]WAK01031.1 VPLPA-CTERM sorting domain-containing protein [Methylobacter sp. YRD-M1]